MLFGFTISTNIGRVRLRAPLYSDWADELFVPDSIDDPDLLYRKLRQERPISRVGETGVHLVATWAHIEDVLQREEDFSANLTGVLTRSDDGELGTFQIPGDGGSQVIATADEPRHAVHRSAVQPNLSAKRVASLEPLLSKFTDEALRPWLENGGGDFAPISEVIPARAVAHVLGLPDGDVSWHRTWAMMGGDILAGAVSGERLFKLATESGQMATYLGEHLDAVELDGVPDTDAPMLHALSYALSNGAIDRNEAIGIAIVMFGAGGESTAALIGSMMSHHGNPLVGTSSLPPS